jgi:hypothetical protein
MIKLIDILREAKQVGILYHFTDDEGLRGILESNELWASETNADHVSLTRDKNGWHVGTRDNIFRISLDGNKISNKYKVQPYAWSDLDRGIGDTESEEAIITDKITNIRNYIIEITLDKKGYDVMKKYLKHTPTNLNQIKQLYPNLKII